MEQTMPCRHGLPHCCFSVCCVRVLCAWAGVQAVPSDPARKGTSGEGSNVHWPRCNCWGRGNCIKILYLNTNILCNYCPLHPWACVQIVVVSVCMVCTIVVSRCIVCSVREQVFRLCPLVITDTVRSGTRVEDNTVFVHPATAGVVVCMHIQWPVASLIGACCVQYCANK